MCRIINAGLMMPKGKHSGFRDAMKYVFPDYYEYQTSTGCSNSLFEYFKEIKPSVIFIQLQQEGVLTRETAEEISKTAKIVIWNGDKREQYPHFMEIVSDFCHCVTHSNQEDVKYIQAKGVNASFLQIGFDNSIFKNLGLKSKNNSIVFMGNHYDKKFPLSDYRNEILIELSSLFTLFVHGSRYKMSNGIITDQKIENLTYNLNKIGLNINHFLSERFTSDRLLRIMGSGTFAISQHYEGIEKDFIIDKHLVTYHNDSELKDKIKYYLEHDLEREKIAIEGYAHVHRNFTFLNMAKNIKKIFESENTNDLF